MDRKEWWCWFSPPSFHSVLIHSDVEMYCNMGAVCYILESTDHPFVFSLLKLRELNFLEWDIAQLRRPKIRFIERIRNIMGETYPDVYEPVAKSTKSLPSYSSWFEASTSDVLSRSKREESDNDGEFFYKI